MTCTACAYGVTRIRKLPPRAPNVSHTPPPRTGGLDSGVPGVPRTNVDDLRAWRVSSKTCNDHDFFFPRTFRVSHEPRGFRGFSTGRQEVFFIAPHALYTFGFRRALSVIVVYTSSITNRRLQYECHYRHRRGKHLCKLSVPVTTVESFRTIVVPSVSALSITARFRGHRYLVHPEFEIVITPV